MNDKGLNMKKNDKKEDCNANDVITIASDNDEDGSDEDGGSNFDAALSHH